MLSSLILIVALVLLGVGTLWLTWWQGSRGEKIATVLALPVGVAGLVVAVAGPKARVAALLLVGVAVLLVILAAERGRLKERLHSWLRAVGRSALKVVHWIGTNIPIFPIVVGLFLVSSVVATSRFWVEPLRVLVAGCEPATELRVLTSPEQLEPVRLLADRYQVSAQRDGCALVHFYVFALPTKQARQALAASWPASALRDAPRPDVWLTDSGREVAQVKTALVGEEGEVIAEDVTVAWSPIVLGMPAATADRLNRESPGQSWSTLVHGKEHDLEVVRPDPASSPAGESGTALLYGGGTEVDRGLARSIEQQVGVSLDSYEYPLGGSHDVLCWHRRLGGPQRTAVVISEQALAKFNNGDPLGDKCGESSGQRDLNDLLRAYYPSDTRILDLRFVRFHWSTDAQADAAVAFREWLAGKDGMQALKDVGLRPPEPNFTAGGLLTERNGANPDARFPREPVSNGALDAAMEVHRTVQRPTRVLHALDSSGSMSALAGAGQGSRFDVASRGVVGALDRMGELDEFGLWVFSGDPAGSGVHQVVAIGPRDSLVGTQPRQSATEAALGGIKPAGKTPLYRAIVDGVAAVGPSDETYSNALVVLTDGEDTTSGLTEAQVVDAVRDKDVRVFVVAVGEASCATAVLQDVTTVTGGRCLDADLSSIDAKLDELFGVLWSEG